MARRPKAKSDAPQATADIVSALQFVIEAQSLTAPENYARMCGMAHGQVRATNGVISAGHPIADQSSHVVHTYQMIAALKRVSSNVSLAPDVNGNLVIRSGKFSAVIQCFGWNELPAIIPDPKIAPATDALKDALRCVHVVVKEKAEQLHASSVLLRAHTCAATDGKIMLEMYHGVDMPQLVIPKSFAQLIAKTDKQLVAFGFSDRSVTFYFADDSWYKTQTYAAKYPDIDRIWAASDGVAVNFNEGTFGAVAAVAPFVDAAHGFVLIDAEHVCTHDIEGVGARFEIPTGLPHFWLKPDQFLECAWAKRYYHSGGMLFLYDDLRRAVIVKRAMNN